MDLVVRRLQRDGLKEIDLTVPGGTTLCIHGRSGSGKTLLLRAIADLDRNRGEVRLGDTERRTVSGPRWRQLAIYLAPESHWWHERVRPHADTWSPHTLQRLGFGDDVLEWEITRLSTGERQRLAIARALARAPCALLLDEPTANLDGTSAQAVEQLLRDYRDEHLAPLLWVSHDPQQRQRVADDSREMVAGALR